uniref:Uncharacterized protein n=1 Tax=Solanum tuberosum TaxID=4113 RepID=M1DZA6_SOLTU
MRDCPTFMAKWREVKQDPPSDLVPIPPNYGRFYAIRSRKDKEASPDEGIGMLIVPYRCKCFIKIPMLLLDFDVNLSRVLLQRGRCNEGKRARQGHYRAKRGKIGRQERMIIAKTTQQVVEWLFCSPKVTGGQPWEKADSAMGNGILVKR